MGVELGEELEEGMEEGLGEGQCGWNCDEGRVGIVVYPHAVQRMEVSGNALVLSPASVGGSLGLVHTVGYHQSDGGCP